MPFNKTNSVYPAYSAILWSLSILFSLRVIGQLIQYFNAVEWLPKLEVWQGSSLPYGVLFTSQLVILTVMIYISRQHTSGRVEKNTDKGKWLLAIGTIYFIGMTVRLLIGLASLSANPWFHKPLPAIFHLVLASFVLLLAAFHMNWIEKNDTVTVNEEAQ
jgi:hypothetical protein